MIAIIAHLWLQLRRYEENIDVIRDKNVLICRIFHKFCTRVFISIVRIFIFDDRKTRRLLLFDSAMMVRHSPRHQKFILFWFVFSPNTVATPQFGFRSLFSYAKFAEINPTTIPLPLYCDEMGLSSINFEFCGKGALAQFKIGKQIANMRKTSEIEIRRKRSHLLVVEKKKPKIYGEL